MIIRDHYEYCLNLSAFADITKVAPPTPAQRADDPDSSGPSVCPKTAVFVRAVWFYIVLVSIP